jgi:Holliday junction resolvasome RuvABC endonuclease subunit
VLDRGVISTSADMPLEARIHRIYDGVRALLEAHAPTALVLEDLYTEYRFPRTALLMAHARGVICLAARQCDVAVLALAPAEVKRAVAAAGAARGPAPPEARGASSAFSRGRRARAGAHRILAPGRRAPMSVPS